MLRRLDARLRRTADNSRGWYDDELTKQRRDWKEGLDFGTTPRWPASFQPKRSP